MIVGNEKFVLPDEAKVNDFYAEVNWNPKDEATNACKIVKFTFPNGDEALVDRNFLHAILFAIGTPEQQRKLIPQVTRRARWYETVLSVKATKDIRKGEDITFPVKLSLPVEDEFGIGEAPKESKVLTRK